LAVSATVFEILTLKARKSLNFSDRPLFEAPVRGEPLRILWATTNFGAGRSSTLCDNRDTSSFYRRSGA